MVAAELALGTAQLGMPYGIANRDGKPERPDARQLLAFAAARGITLWDTAPAYGDSEEIIGEAVATLDITPRIVSKLPSISKCLRERSSQHELRLFVRRAIQESLSSLAVDRIDFYLVHDEQDFGVYGQDLLDVLEECRRESLVGHIGISVYSTKVATVALESGRIEAIQLPCNLFDHRFHPTIALAQTRDVLVFARSIFLQGLFFLPGVEVCQHVPDAAPWLAALQKLASECGRSIAELAICYVRDLPGIAALVVGAETVDQVAVNLELMSAPALTSELRERISQLFHSVPLHVVNPVLWRSQS
ncbi:MAG: aldo/keto reductase [Anaerolineae bacterium]|nr:aldo/keto reductase [Anaerolineae bacterium]